MVLPLFTYGNEGKEDTLENSQMLSYNILARIDVDLSSMAFPYVISIPAPSERVIGISGPTFPNVQNWVVSNGYLKITYSQLDFDLFTPGEMAYIQVATSPMKYYVILLNFK